MITFRCTKKVRDLLGLTDRDLDDESDGELYEWFVETATIERYRCLLFTHKLSLYSFWVLAVRKPDLLALDELFQHHALAMLKADGYTDVEIARLLPRSGYRFAKTNSRPVTGSMNDHVKNSRWYFEHDGGIRIADGRAIDRQLNRTPMGALAPGSQMDFPIDVSDQDHPAVWRRVTACLWLETLRRSVAFTVRFEHVHLSWPGPLKVLQPEGESCRE